jgi:hypothetical protein
MRGIGAQKTVPEAGFEAVYEELLGARKTQMHRRQDRIRPRHCL